MYSDDEIDKLYLGKPLDNDSAHIYGGFVDLITFTDEEAKKLFLDLPMISRLMQGTPVEDD